MARQRALIAIAVSALVLLAAGLIYLRPGSTLASRTPPIAAPTSSPSTGPCAPTQMKLTGLYTECAFTGIGMSCPTGSFDRARVVHIHGARHDFILYIEVNGGYHGPGDYALAPWPNDTLGKPDGVAKVAVREWTTGKFWRSSAGSLTIDQSEEAGWVYAGLGAGSSSPVDVELNIAGFWSCYQPQLPGPRAGGAACPPAAGEDTLLKELTTARIDVTAASASTASTLFPEAEAVCLMDVASDSFEVAFFRDNATAASMHICESRSAGRYIYRVNGRTIDSAQKQYWSQWGDALLWTESSGLDTSLRRALGASRQKC